MQTYFDTVRDTDLTFGGRSSRRDYWTFTLVNTLVTLTLWVLVADSLLAASAQEKTPSFVSSILLLLTLTYSVGMFLPTLSVTIRRLHDGGDSGGVMIVWLLPFIGGLILLWLLARRGQPGSNKWGPNPKGVQAPVNAF